MLRLSHPSGICKADISLPASKSISNRALILQACGAGKVELFNLSNAEDTLLMQEALKHPSGIVDVRNAGTCMRFLTAFFASQPGVDVRLVGDERMQQRPIGILVKALREIGADIDYEENPGFPPLHIVGRKLRGGEVHVDGSVSSQYSSALMMIAPHCENGISIHIEGETGSRPYIEMTTKLMRQFGYELTMQERLITIPSHQSKQVQEETLSITIPPDWSAASYWYEIAALSKSAHIFLTDLKADGMQGDEIIAQMMVPYGVQSDFSPQGVLLTKSRPFNTSVELDLLNYPDLMPALAATGAGLEITTTLSGLSSLMIKESNRLEAMERELLKCGYNVHATADLIVIERGNPTTGQITRPVSTWKDHRIAMAMAPLSLRHSLVIADAGVVVKSYPGFWDDLERAGFNCDAVI